MKKRIAVILTSIMMATLLMSGGYGFWRKSLEVIVDIQPIEPQITALGGGLILEEADRKKSPEKGQEDDLDSGEEIDAINAEVDMSNGKDSTEGQVPKTEELKRVISQESKDTDTKTDTTNSIGKASSPDKTKEPDTDKTNDTSITTSDNNSGSNVSTNVVNTHSSSDSSGPSNSKSSDSLSESSNKSSSTSSEISSSSSDSDSKED